MKAHARPALVVTLALMAAPVTASTIAELKLAIGREAQNTIGTPVFEASGVGKLRLGAIESAYDKKAKLVSKAGSGFMTRGPQYDHGPNLDLAAVLTEALQSEAPAMGFRLTDAEDYAWVVKGALKDIYMESRQVPYGATQFWGYLEVELTVQKAGGQPQTQKLRAHKYYAAYNAGMGRKDEAAEGLAHLLLEGAQEIVAQLNRKYFKAPPHPDMEKRAATLGGGKEKQNDLHLVGLSGAASAVPVLLRLIPASSEEADRAHMIEALGRIGSPDAVAPLAGRYATEDEDCRWETLRAMDAIGGEAAKAVLDLGLKDENQACQRLSGRILGTPAKR